MGREGAKENLTFLFQFGALYGPKMFPMLLVSVHPTVLCLFEGSASVKTLRFGQSRDLYCTAFGDLKHINIYITRHRYVYREL